MSTKLTMHKNAIRVLCTGDRHVKANRIHLGPYYKAHDRIVEIAKQYQVQAVADCGDSRVDCGSSPDAEDCELSRLILPLAQAGIAYWSVDGNHDRRGAAQREITANSRLQYFKDRDLWKGIEYWNDYEPRIINFPMAQLNEARCIQVLPLPYPPRHSFATGKELKTKQDLDKAASTFIQDALCKAVSSVDGVCRYDITKPFLVLFHGTVDSPRLQTAGEARMPAGHDVNIPVNLFTGLPGSVAVACGHIHKHQVLSEPEGPLVFYTGPLVPQEFDHENMDCGVVVVEFGTDGEVRHEFVPIETIGYKTVTLDITKAIVDASCIAMIVDGVNAEVPNPERTVVKVVIKASADQALDTGAIREALEEAGIIEPRILIERPEAPAAVEMERQIHAEIGSNVQANVSAYLGEHPEITESLKASDASEQDVLDAANEIESEVTNAI